MPTWSEPFAVIPLLLAIFAAGRPKSALHERAAIGPNGCVVPVWELMTLLASGMMDWEFAFPRDVNLPFAFRFITDSVTLRYHNEISERLTLDRANLRPVSSNGTSSLA